MCSKWKGRVGKSAPAVIALAKHRVLTSVLWHLKKTFCKDIWHSPYVYGLVHGSSHEEATGANVDDNVDRVFHCCSLTRSVHSGKSPVSRGLIDDWSVCCWSVFEMWSEKERVDDQMILFIPGRDRSWIVCSCAVECCWVFIANDAVVFDQGFSIEWTRKCRNQQQVLRLYDAFLVARQTAVADSKWGKGRQKHRQTEQTVRGKVSATSAQFTWMYFFHCYHLDSCVTLSVQHSFLAGIAQNWVSRFLFFQKEERREEKGRILMAERRTGKKTVPLKTLSGGAFCWCNEQQWQQQMTSRFLPLLLFTILFMANFLANECTRMLEKKRFLLSVQFLFASRDEVLRENLQFEFWLVEMTATI